MVSLLSLLLACLTLLMVRTSGKLVEQLHRLRFSTRLAFFAFEFLFRRGLATLAIFMMMSIAVLYKRCQVFIFFAHLASPFVMCLLFFTLCACVMIVSVVPLRKACYVFVLVTHVAFPRCRRLLSFALGTPDS